MEETKPFYSDIKKEERDITLDSITNRLNDLKIEFELYDTYDEMNVPDEMKPDVEPFEDHAIILVAADKHYFFDDCELLLGTAIFH